MADKFAPPTPEELAELSKTHDISAPPTEKELEALQYSPLQSAGMGAINQLGLAPIVGGAALAAKDVAGPEYSLKDFLERYRAQRDILKGKFQEAEETNPKSYLAGNIAAGLALPVPGAAAAKGLKGFEALKAAAKSGAVLGGVAGLATSPSDLTKAIEEPEQLVEAAKSTALGAGIGAGAGIVGGALGKAIEKARGLRSEAKKEALKALGADSDIVSKEYGLQKGIAGAEPGYEKGIGEEALNLIKPFGGAEQVRQDVRPILEKQAKLVSDIRKEAAEQINNKQLSFKDFDDEIQKIKNQFAQNLEGQLNGEEKTNKIFKLLDKQKQLYDFAKNDITRLNDLKVSLEKGISDKVFAKNIVEAPEEVQAELALSQMLKNRIESMAEQAKPGLGDQLRNSNLRLSNLMDIATAAIKSTIKDTTKQAAEIGDYVALDFGLPAYLAKKTFEAQTGQSVINTLQRAKVLGLRGAADILEAPMGGLGNLAGKLPVVGAPLQQLSSLGPSGGAFVTGAGKALSAAGRAPTNLSGMSSPNRANEESTPLIYHPQEIMRHSTRLMQSPDPKAQQVGQMLANIANRPDREKNAMMFSLMENPAYRRYLHEGEAK